MERLPVRRRRSDVWAAAGGLAVLGLGMLAVGDSNEAVTGLEEDAFRAVNDLPEALYPLIWPFQQLGVLVAGPIVAAVALVTRRFRLAFAALAATVAKLWLERVVKETVSRQRPQTSVGDANLRGDVSSQGESFVSGHAVLIAALAVLVAPYLRGRWRFLPWAAIALVMFGRVYVGAHNPLDVICGAGLGIAIGSVLNLVVGVPARPQDKPAPGGAASEPSSSSR
ncbi:MAG: phosphatase PAP2 family protein [Acidimicrobiales bacterium]